MKVGGAGKRMQAVDGQQEINLEWPNGCLADFFPFFFYFVSCLFVVPFEAHFEVGML